MITQTDAILLAWLQRAIAEDGPYDPATIFMGVYTAIADHGPATVLADLTQGTGALATRVAVASWSAPYKMVDGRWAVDGPPCRFSPASAAEAQTVVGWFVASLATLGVLKCFAAVVPPISLPNETWDMVVVFRLTIDPAGRFSAEIVWNGGA